MQPYPLYDDLYHRVNERLDKAIDIKKICTTINSIAQPPTSAEEALAHYKEIGALILHHELLSNNGYLITQVPFEGKLMAGGKGLLYYIMTLPPILQQIIAQYIEDSGK